MIALGLVTLRPGEMGGSETYARSLVAALAKHGSLPYVCLVPQTALDAADGMPAFPVDGLRGGPATRLATLVAAAARSRSQRRLLPGVRAVHYPFTIPVPALGVPAAITLHDLTHREQPELWSRSVRAFRAVAYDRPARRARLVIVASNFIRDRAAALLRLPADRIRVVPHGVDQRFHPGAEPREPFLLYPARRWPHKNHARLLEAFALVRRERPELRLVLAGASFEPNELPDGVETPGLVSADELASLYRRASGLVFASLHESFGQPPLEAMASGCPVACSNAAALPEICGDAAVYFDPGSPEEIARGVLAMLGDADRLAAAGLARARGFTWERAAAGHEEAYRLLLEGV